MLSRLPLRITLVVLALLFIRLIYPDAAALKPSAPLAQSVSLTIVGPDRRPNPVVNEESTLALSVIDANGQAINGVTYESGSPDIARVDAQTGVVTGVQRGFATITARRGSDTVSSFVVVTKVTNGSGVSVPGGTEKDMGGRIYICDPTTNVVLRKESLNAAPRIFAGQSNRQGRVDGPRAQSLFAGPVAVAVDNSGQGGVFIADALNHAIRRISLNDNVETLIGNGSPGVNTNDVTPFAQAQFRGARGLALGAGRTLFIADTENHAVYRVNMARRDVRLLAGQPGVQGGTDGRGRAARFSRPVSITVNRDGTSIAVADTGNRALRLITSDGSVTTIGPLSSMAASDDRITPLAEGDAFEFDNPVSVSFDNLNNLYVVDNTGAQVITRVGNRNQIFALAQAGTFGQAASLVVRGTETFVLDANASPATAIKVVTVGAPQIQMLSRNLDNLEGGSEVVITGRNFAPESVVVLGDRVVSDARVISATEIRFIVPAQDAPGRRTLSVQTRGGVAQAQFTIVAKRLADINNGEITTIAGGVQFIGDSGAALQASLRLPRSLAINSQGDLIIADGVNNRVRRVNDAGVITTIVGNGTPAFTGDGSVAIGASINIPSGVAFDSDGNIIVADSFNLRIRRVDALTGVITTIAGNGGFGFSGDGGPAVNAELGGQPTSIAVDSSGNIFFTDLFNNRVRRVDATGIITTVAGNGRFGAGSGDFGGDNGPANRALLNQPFALALNAQGDLFIADTNNNRIRRVSAADGIITTIAGNGMDGFDGDNKPATMAALGAPTGLAIDPAGNLFVADFLNNRVRKIDAATGMITTVAGTGAFGFSGDGGAAAAAMLAAPVSVAIDLAGNLFISDLGNNRVRRVDAVSGTITTVVGANISVGDGGPAVSAGLANPKGIALSGRHLFISDRDNSRIRRVDLDNGNIVTFAGNGIADFSGDNGPAILASLNNPGGIAFDSSGNLIVADRDNNRIRRIDTNGVITTIAGNGMFGNGGDGGPASQATVALPDEIVIDRAGNIIIADTEADRLRRIDSSGVIRVIAGASVGGFGGDGAPALNARLRQPQGLALDGSGNLFFADTGNQRIRRIDGVTSIIKTIAGNGTPGFNADGIPATGSMLNDPLGLAIDQAGNIFIADEDNNRVRRIDATTGIITTVVGDGTPGFSGDNGPAARARLAFPKGLTIDSAGNLFIAAGFNNAVRVIKGVAITSPRQLSVTGAIFRSKVLTINGSGFTVFGARVTINGMDVTSLITSQTDSVITLSGSKKKLNLKKGANPIIVNASGGTSNTFSFMR